MSKLVVLKLDGDFKNRGFQVSLEIGAEGARPEIEIRGALSPEPELAAHIQRHWQETYRRAGMLTRQLKPKTIKYDGSVNNWFRECRESAKKLRDRLSAWLDCEEFREIDKRLREKLKPEEAIRVLIRTEDEHLQKLPWHLWDFIDRYPLSEVALSSLKFERPKFPPVTAAGKIRILAILGHSAGIDIESDREILKNLTDAEVVFLPEPKRAEIGEHLWEQAWDIVFFAGHSETEGDAGRIYINPTDSLTIDELWYGLRKAAERGLKLAIFNSCDGLGLARQLDDLLIPQIIVMRELVPDRVAQEFLKHFLAAFAGGQPLYLAVRQARERLHDELEGEFPCASWLPAIWQNPAVVPPTWKEWLESKNRGEFCGESLAENPAPTAAKFVLSRNWQKVLLASAACAAAVVGARSLGFLEPWELQAFDALMVARPNEPPDRRILIVNITEDDLQLPEQKDRRDSLADLALERMLEKLEVAKPAVVGLAIYRDFPVHPKVLALRKRWQHQDNLIAICKVSDASTKHPGIAPPPDIPKERDDRIGFSDFTKDKDDIIRRHILALRPSPASPCTSFYAFSTALAFRYLKAKEIVPYYTPQGDLILGNTVFQRLRSPMGGYQKADTRDYQILLNYRAAKSSEEMAPNVTLKQVLEGRINPDDIKDKIVIIGVNARSLHEFNRTPYGTLPRVTIHAQMTSQIISAILEGRRPISMWSWWQDGVWIWGWCAVGGASALYGKSAQNLVLASSAAIAVLSGICFILLTQSLWVPLVPSAIGLVATGCAVAKRSLS